MSGVKNRKCNKNCICLKCQKSCMKACRNCSDIMEMHVVNCSEYADKGNQMTIEDFEKELKE